MRLQHSLWARPACRGQERPTSCILILGGRRCKVQLIEESSEVGVAAATLAALGLSRHGSAAVLMVVSRSWMVATAVWCLSQVCLVAGRG